MEALKLTNTLLIVIILILSTNMFFQRIDNIIKDINSSSLLSFLYNAVIAVMAATGFVLGISALSLR